MSLIEPRENGQWAVKKPHAERASILAETIDKAVAYAIEHAPEGDMPGSSPRRSG
jgi:hypothetical protein